MDKNYIKNTNIRFELLEKTEDLTWDWINTAKKLFDIVTDRIGDLEKRIDKLEAE